MTRMTIPLRRCHAGSKSCSGTSPQRSTASAIAEELIATGHAYSDLLTCNARASAAAGPFWESVGFLPVDTHGITHVHRLRQLGEQEAPIGRVWHSWRNVVRSRCYLLPGRHPTELTAEAHGRLSGGALHELVKRSIVACRVARSEQQPPSPRSLPRCHRDRS